MKSNLAFAFLAVLTFFGVVVVSAELGAMLQRRSAATIAPVPAETQYVMPDGNTVTAPAGSRVTYRMRKVDIDQPEMPVSESRSGEARSIGVWSRGDSTESAGAIESPTLALGLIRTIGGGGKWNLKVLTTTGIGGLLLLGALMVAAGVALLVVVSPRLIYGWALIAAGGAVLAMAMLVKEAAIVLALGGVVLLAMAAWFVWSQYRRRAAEQAVQATAQAIEAEDKTRRAAGVPDATAVVKRIKGAVAGALGNKQSPANRLIKAAAEKTP